MRVTTLLTRRENSMRKNLLKKNLRLRKKNLMISRKPLRKVKRKPRPEDVVVVAAGAVAGGEARKRKERKRRDSRSLLRTSPLPSNSSKPMTVLSKESHANQGKVETVVIAREETVVETTREKVMPRTNGVARAVLELADVVAIEMAEMAGVAVTTVAETVEAEEENKEEAEVVAVEKDKSEQRHPGNSKHRNRNTNKKESKKIIESN